MSLRSKLVLILAGVIVLYGGIHLAIQRMVVFPSFEELERRGASDDLHRAAEAIHNEVRHLDTTCHDWSAWDDTWQFVQDGNAKFIEANLQDASLESANIDLMYFVRLDGTVVHRSVREPQAGETALDLPEFSLEPRPLDDPLRCVDSVDASSSGLLLTSSGPMIVSSRPIARSARVGPIAGYVVMGRMLDGASLASLIEQTSVGFELWPLRGTADLPAHVREGWSAVDAGEGEAIRARDDRMIDAFSVLRDLDGKPALLLQAGIPRVLMGEGARAIAFALWSAVGAGVLILCVLTWLLQRIVVDPLARLTARAVAIGRDDRLETRFDSRRQDEIGVLSRELDAMCGKLSASRSQMVETALLVGMSEVATDVLHNVGNVLTSVHVSAGILTRSLHDLRVDDVDRVARTFEAHSADLAAFLSRDEKGRQMLAYLSLLARRLEEERGTMLRETQNLSEGLVHIQELVQAQQSFAGRSETLETVSLRREIQAAIRISGAEAGGRVEVIRDIEFAPRVRIQKHKLLQILVNLLKNARESVEEAKAAHPQLCVRARCSQDGKRAVIEVSDNGVGIAPERLVSVFAHGHTTKAGGHGFGLHGSANAAKEMGGSISVASPGPGRGATFTVDLPAEREAQAA